MNLFSPKKISPQRKPVPKAPKKDQWPNEEGLSLNEEALKRAESINFVPKKKKQTPVSVIAQYLRNLFSQQGYNKSHKEPTSPISKLNLLEPDDKTDCMPFDDIDDSISEERSDDTTFHSVLNSSAGGTPSSNGITPSNVTIIHNPLDEISTVTKYTDTPESAGLIRPQSPSGSGSPKPRTMLPQTPSSPYETPGINPARLFGSPASTKDYLNKALQKLGTIKRSGQEERITPKTALSLGHHNNITSRKRPQESKKGCCLPKFCI